MPIRERGACPWATPLDLLPRAHDFPDDWQRSVNTVFSAVFHIMKTVQLCMPNYQIEVTRLFIKVIVITIIAFVKYKLD